MGAWYPERRRTLFVCRGSYDAWHPRTHDTSYSLNLRPAGMPISGRLRIPPERSLAVVRETVAVIDAVHGDGNLPPLPVRLSRGRRQMGGYEYARDGSALRLTVSSRALQPHVTVAHEVGHYLDQHGLGTPPRFASESGRLQDVLNAIEQTAAMRTLRSRQGQRQVRLNDLQGRGYSFPIDHSYVAYLLQPRECFARAYAQYIALASKDPRMLAQLADLWRAVGSGQVYHVQWAEDDFVAVAEAVERLFRRRGWMQ
jgi:hypothetical protein